MFRPCSFQGQSCSGAVLSLFLFSSGSSLPSGLPCLSLAGESTTTSPSGPAALWTIARETGIYTYATQYCTDKRAPLFTRNCLYWPLYAFFSPQKLCFLFDPNEYLQHGHPAVCYHVLIPVHCSEIQEDREPQGKFKNNKFTNFHDVRSEV